MQQPFDYELLAKCYMNFVSNRYPSADKLLKLAKTLGIEENTKAQIIVFSQFRDAVRQLSPRIYQSPQHKEDIYMAILEALEELERQADEEEMENEEEEDDYYK